VIARPADQPGSCDQQPVAGHLGGRLFARHLRLAVLLGIDLVGRGGGE